MKRDRASVIALGLCGALAACTTNERNQADPQGQSSNLQAANPAPTPDGSIKIPKKPAPTPTPNPAPTPSSMPKPDPKTEEKPTESDAALLASIHALAEQIKADPSLGEPAKTDFLTVTACLKLLDADAVAYEDSGRLGNLHNGLLLLDADIARSSPTAVEMKLSEFVDDIHQRLKLMKGPPKTPPAADAAKTKIQGAAKTIADATTAKTKADTEAANASTAKKAADQAVTDTTQTVTKAKAVVETAKSDVELKKATLVAANATLTSRQKDALRPSTESTDKPKLEAAVASAKIDVAAAEAAHMTALQAKSIAVDSLTTAMDAQTKATNQQQTAATNETTANQKQADASTAQSTAATNLASAVDALNGATHESRQIEDLYRKYMNIDGEIEDHPWWDGGLGFGAALNAVGTKEHAFGLLVSLRLYPFGRWWAAVPSSDDGHDTAILWEHICDIGFERADGTKDKHAGAIAMSFLRHLSIVGGLSIGNFIADSDTSGQAKLKEPVYFLGLGIDVIPQASFVLGAAFFQVQRKGFFETSILSGASASDSPNGTRNQTEFAFYFGISLNAKALLALANFKADTVTPSGNAK